MDRPKGDNRKIDLLLPEWVHPDANISIYAGIEGVARFRPGLSKRGWEIKIERCSQCGYCCSKVNNDHPMGKNPITNACRHLTFYANQYHCGMTRYRPFNCCYADNAEGDGTHCTVKWVRHDVRK